MIDSINFVNEKIQQKKFLWICFRRCTSNFECINEIYNYKQINEINKCTIIEQVIPEIISLHSLNTQVIYIEINKFYYLIFIHILLLFI